MQFLLLLLVFLSPVSSPRSLGIPCAGKTWYARNIWTMTFYDNRLFVGCGNSSNNPPSSNAGPIGVWVYRSGIGWSNEYNVNEEQINRFVFIDSSMIIPGHDAREGWEFGNWYSRTSKGWQKHRNIPNAAHVFDITEYNGLWFAALGTNYPISGQSIAISKDRGQTWKLQSLPIGVQTNIVYYNCSRYMPSLVPAWRVYNFFTISGELYANTGEMDYATCSNSKAVLTDSGHYALHWNGQGFEANQLDLFDGKTADRVERATVYNGQTVYIGAQTVNDQQWDPVGLFTVDGDLQGRPLTLQSCERPQDISLLSGALYVLCNQPTSTNWLVNVQMTCDLKTWTSVSEFVEPTFARSFAVIPGSIFIALGADTDAPASTRNVVGQVLKNQFVPTSDCTQAH